MFVPERAKGQPSSAAITSAVGHGAVKIPAVLVPQGGSPPGRAYVHVGKADFRPDQDSGVAGAATRACTRQQSSQPIEPDSAEPMPTPRLPRTRYRLGGGLGGDRSPGPPPDPACPGFAADSMLAAVSVWRSMRNAGRLRSASHANPRGLPAVPKDAHAQEAARGHAQDGAPPDSSHRADPPASQPDATRKPDSL